MSEGEIYIEIVPHRHAIEVIAIHSETAREIRFMAPTDTPESAIKELARAKMSYVLSKDDESPNKTEKPGRGIVV
ncbi:MAG: hypothetical protein CMK07_06950 [Ponticaulis sp.]|nr:hypothetical protein [Ponticaulis sp.]